MYSGQNWVFLTWNAYITEITKKAAKRFYFLVQLRRARVFQRKIYAFFTLHACALSLTMLYTSLPFARIRTRSEKNNANHKSWYRISACFSAYEFTNGCHGNVFMETQRWSNFVEYIVNINYYELACAFPYL